MCGPCAQSGHCSSPTRFTVRQHFRTSRILKNVTVMRESGGPVWGVGHPDDHPFHCWILRKRRYSRVGSCSGLGLFLVQNGNIPARFLTFLRINSFFTFSQPWGYTRLILIFLVGISQWRGC